MQVFDHHYDEKRKGRKEWKTVSHSALPSAAFPSYHHMEAEVDGLEATLDISMSCHGPGKENKRFDIW
jgi:hypothetical protein